MLKRFMKYYKPHTKLFVLDMLAALTVALLAVVYPMVTRTMLNDLIPNKQYQMIVWAGLGLLVIYVIRMLLQFFIQYEGHMMGVRMQAQMRSDMFRHLEKLPFSFYDNNETGKIMSRMTSDLMDVSELAHHGPENIIISSISVIVSFVYLFSINPYLTLIVFACVPFLLIIAISLRKKMRTAFKESRQSTAQINAALESSISGIRVTKAFTNAEKESEKFEEGNKWFVSARQKAYHAMGRFHSGTAFVTDIFNVIVLIAGGLFLYNNWIEWPDYSAFVVSINLFISPVMTMISFMEQFQNGVTGFERFLEIMDTPVEQDAEGAVDVGRLEGHIRLEDVTYGYEEGKEVLESVTLDIGKGKKFALVGPSGGGKTTICHLIPNFYKVESGRILLDGQDIRSITMDSLRRNIGIVQQDIYLFNASIRDNILYGRLDATEEEVIEAAKRANIHDYIMTLENGYDTVIGERGVRLSGGQKQRLSIARVFLKDPAILILDEATSALDNTTEILIQGALDELCRGRTTLVVAHRLSTIRNADEIAVIAGGRITEQGSHDELIALDGTYAKLYREQFRES
ncbi:MAG: ABC transporter ATP-binding protein [Ruminococcaceae bacterium]|nr:ABC transporter ATP-binding protein [Oscillospiraceae bacterium]